MTVNIRTFASMNHSVVDTLWEMGFRTSDDILERTATADDRESLASQAGIEADLLLDLARRADLARIKGVGNLYAVLLKHAGINSIQDLARQDVDTLYKRVIELNEAMKVARRIPKPANVQQWVDGARAMVPVIGE